MALTMLPWDNTQFIRGYILFAMSRQAYTEACNPPDIPQFDYVSTSPVRALRTPMTEYTKGLIAYDRENPWKSESPETWMMGYSTGQSLASYGDLLTCLGRTMCAGEMHSCIRRDSFDPLKTAIAWCSGFLRAWIDRVLIYNLSLIEARQDGLSERAEILEGRRAKMNQRLKQVIGDSLPAAQVLYQQAWFKGFNGRALTL